MAQVVLSQFLSQAPFSALATHPHEAGASRHPGARVGVTYSQGSPYPPPPPAASVAKKEGVTNPWVLCSQKHKIGALGPCMSVYICLSLQRETQNTRAHTRTSAHVSAHTHIRIYDPSV